MRKRKDGNSGFIIPVVIGTVGVGAVAALFLLVLPGEDGDITTVETEDLTEVVGFEESDDVIDRERLLLFESDGSATEDETYLSGDGVPQNSVGNEGDYYVDLVTGNIYRKSGGVWEPVPLELVPERLRAIVSDGSPSGTPSSNGDAVPNVRGPITTNPFSEDNPFFPDREYDFPEIVAPTNIFRSEGPSDPNGAAPLAVQLPPPPNIRAERGGDPSGPNSAGDQGPVIEENPGGFGGGSDGPESDYLKNILVAAAAGFAACWVGGLLSSVSGNPLTVKTDDTTQGAKECLLDGGAYGVVKSVGIELASSYIDWALSGFHGKPLFITNPDQFWEDFADKEIGRALDSSGFGVLCNIDGSKLDISNLLHLKYRRIETEPPRCTLSDYKNNIEDFIDNPIDITGIDNAVEITEEDPLIINPGGDAYKTYSVTFNLFEAVDKNGNKINPDDVRHTSRWTAVALKKCPAGRDDVITHNQLSVTRNVPDDKIKSYKYETGRLKEEDVVACIQASKIVNGVEYIVVGKGLRENEGLGGGIEPAVQAKVDNASKKLERVGKSVDKGIERLITFGNKVTQGAEIDEKVADVKKDAAEDQESLTSDADPTALASFKYECPDQGDGIKPLGEKCLNVYQGADKVSDTQTKNVETQVDSVNQADELSEVIGAVINATAIGLIRGPLEKGLGKSFSGGGAARLAAVEDNLELERQGNRWFLTLFDKNNVYTDLNFAKIKHEDAISLFQYINNNVDTHYTLPSASSKKLSYLTVPEGYTRPSNERAGDDSLLENFSDAYKVHNLAEPISPRTTFLFPSFSFLGIELPKIRSYEPAGAEIGLVDILENLTTIRTVRHRTCTHPFVGGRGGNGRPSICGNPSSVNDTIFLFDEDRRSLQRAAGRPNPILSTGKKQIDTLLSIYESTVKAHIEIVGLPSDYEDGVEDKRRESILKRQYATELRGAGASSFEIVQHFTIDTFETSSAKVFVEEHVRDGSSLNEIDQLLFLNDCEREPNAEKVRQYIETDCTIKDFERIVREKINRLPDNPEEIVYYTYRLGHLSELIQLPRSSAVGVPFDGNNFEGRQRIVDRYTALGNIFAGEDARASSRNWGELAAAEARREYVDSFGKKYEGKINETLREFLESVPSRYQN